MAHDEEAHDRSLLLAELRRDAHVDGESLARVRERVSVTLIGGPLAMRARPPARRRAVWGGLAAALMVGTALGSGGHALVSSYWAAQRPIVAVPVQRAKAPAPRAPSAVASLPAVPAPEVSERPPEPSAVPRSKPRVALRLAPVASAEPGLAGELAELEQARRALADGDAVAALGVLEAQRALHPTSMLAQEREALGVKALVKAGRYDEARAAGASFHARYPNSALSGAVRGALAAIP